MDRSRGVSIEDTVPALVRAALLLCVLASVLASLPAYAWPQTLVAAHAGIASSFVEGASLGPSGGLSGDLALGRQLAVELALDQSFHQVAASGGPISAAQTGAGLGLQYRFDVAPAVPFVTLSARWARFSPRGFEPVDDLSGALAIGFLYSFAASWFAGAEARYGYSLSDGAFPSSSTFVLRVGWMSEAF
jgi:hypothetical protein